MPPSSQGQWVVSGSVVVDVVVIVDVHVNVHVHERENARRSLTH